MNVDLLKKQFEELLEFKVKELNQKIDLEDLRSLFIAIKNFYIKYPPEEICEDLIFIYTNDDLEDKYGMEYLNENNVNLNNLIDNIKYPAIIQVFKNGKCYFKSNIKIKHKDYKNSYLSYVLNKTGEYIFTEGKELMLDESAINSRSIFSNPTYMNLDSALDHYYVTHAKQSICKLIENSWTSRERIYWKNAPENDLRDSLWQYLKASLRGVNNIISREQNTSEKNPVDIKIQWNQNYAEALIEIKWLGKSMNEEKRITSTYTNSRAVKGSQQLVDYVIESKNQNINQHFKGYLIVFDGRRKNTENIINDDLWAYKDKEIENIPEIFDEYRCVCKRYFMEPLHTDMKFSS